MTPERSMQIRKASLAWRVANPDEYRASNERSRKKRNMDPLDTQRRLIERAKSRAICLGLPFNLSSATMLWPTHCPVFGTPFHYLRGMGHDRTAASLDRIIPELGYVEGNVRVISRRANAMKQDCTDPEAFRRLAMYVEGKL